MRSGRSVRIGIWVAATALAPLFAAGAHAQSRDASTAPAPSLPGGSIAGTVVLDGQPSSRVRRAVVTLNLEGGGDGRTTLTTDDGSFEFGALPPGRYLLAATKAGYLRANYGATRPGRPGTAIALAERARVTVTVPMTRGGVITGTVQDLHADPASGVEVQIVRVRGAGSARRIDHETTTMTDDRGVYRAYELPPGEYLVAAQPRLRHSRDARVLETSLNDVAWAEQARRGSVGTRPPAQAVWLAPVYYPGTADAGSAQLVSVTAGAERTGIDIGLRLQPTARVQGTVSNPDGSPAQDAAIYLVPADQSHALGHGGYLEAHGPEFTFSNVTPGTFVLTARSGYEGPFLEVFELQRSAEPVAPPAPRPAMWASATIAVNPGPATPIALTLQPGSTIDGRVAWADGGEGKTPLPPMSIRIDPIAGDQRLSFYSTAEIQPDGTFSLAGVIPGRYQIRIAPTKVAAFWSVQSISTGNRDVTDLPLEILPGIPPSTVVIALTSQPTDLEGTITTPDGRAAPDYHVVAFPVDRRYWIPDSRRIRAVRPATDGRFAFEDLPPADYYLAALTDVEPREWFDPAFLDRLIPLALRVRVAEGVANVQDIKIAR
jgi:hypothetical protein